MMKFVTILALLGLSVGVFVKYTRPTYTHAEETKQKVTKLDEALQQARNIRKIRERLSRQFNEFSEEKIDRLRKMIPDHVDNIKLILDIDGIASQYGLRIANVQIQSQTKDAGVGGAPGAPAAGVKLAPKSETGKKSLSLSFSVTARYDEFLAFLHDLETSLRIVDVEKITLGGARGGATTGGFDAALGAAARGTSRTAVSSSKPRYTFNVTLRTYWLSKDSN